MIPEAGRETRTPASQTRPMKGATEVTEALNRVLADAFSLYIKTKNFHWHVRGPHFRDYHLLFDEQAAQILATTDLIAERVRKIGGTTLRSIGHIAKLQRIKDNDAPDLTSTDMLRELAEDNRMLVATLREAHELADEHDDVATESLLEVWIDDAEKRVWFLVETNRSDAPPSRAH